MNATALISDERMNFSLETVTLPALQADEVLLRTAYSGVSIGTEFALIRQKVSWGPFPLCPGYMATGVVEQCGAAVSEVRVGDQVYVRGNRALTLADGRSVSPVSGTHCSHIVTQVGGTHGLGILPAGADLEAASMFVMPAVSYNGVDMAEPKLGETVLVYGSGLIGIGVVAAAALRGCRVIAVDVQDAQLELAKTLGADVCLNSAKVNLPEVIERMYPGGADVVFECSGIPALIKPAMDLCRVDGKFVWQGNYGEKPIAFDFLTAHGKRLKTFFPCDDGYHPCREAVLKHMTRGLLPWEKTISHHITAKEAPEVYAKINAGDTSYVGVTIHWA